MTKFRLSVTGNMIVKNEDQWVWFSIQSVLPYVDELLITDTGSSDKTISIIESIHSPKIKFSKVKCLTSSDVTIARQLQLEQSKNDWVWTIDGDEIYPESTAKECMSALESSKYEGLVVRRLDLLGDIYHHQLESVGAYLLFGNTGHLVTRFVNKKAIAGLHYVGDYPLEGWYDSEGKSTRDRNPSRWYISKKYLYHAMYLKRSSLGSNLPMFNRGKYKIETGLSITSSLLPEVFSLPRPDFVPDPLVRRGQRYEILARLITPIKKLKRKIMTNSKIPNKNRNGWSVTKWSETP